MNDSGSEQRPILIADIGGTNARFALSIPQTPFFQVAQTLQCKDFELFEDAVETYLRSHNITQLGGICFAVAGPIRNDRVTFTNNHWEIDSAKLNENHATDKVQLLNDFEAIAYSLVSLDSNDMANDIMPIGGDWKLDSEQNFTVGVVGPGSGLGVGGMMRRNGHLFPLVTEGGHISFPPENDLQIKILRYLQKKYDDRVSCERLLSGPGIINIHEALCEIYGQENPSLSAADIAITAVNEADKLSQEAFGLFFEILGQVAGDISLTMGAVDGVFIAGGIAQRYPEQLLNSRFRAGFENKGRYRELMKSTPTWLVMHQNPGLLGASVYAQRYL